MRLEIIPKDTLNSFAMLITSSCKFSLIAEWLSTSCWPLWTEVQAQKWLFWWWLCTPALCFSACHAASPSFSLSGAPSLRTCGVAIAFGGQDKVMKIEVSWLASWEDSISLWLRAVPQANMGSPSPTDRSHSFSGLQLTWGSSSSALHQFSSHWLLPLSQIRLKTEPSRLADLKKKNKQKTTYLGVEPLKGFHIMLWNWIFNISFPRESIKQNRMIFKW